MKKTRMSTKLLSVLLTAIMLFTTVSVGIIVPETKIEADAAEVGETITVTTIAQLNAAISTANTAGVNKITTIKLGANINHKGSLGKLTEITTGNIVFNLSGYNFIVTYSASTDTESSNSTYQIPSENANKYHKDDHVLDNSLITVGASGSLQIINTAATDSYIQLDAQFEDGATKGEIDHQTSASLIRSAGNLVIGDKDNSSNNNFVLSTRSSTRMTNTDLGWSNGRKGASANAQTIIVDGTSSVFKMYGGIVQASGVARFRRTRESYLIVYPLNINSCYSAEIYGGTVRIPNLSGSDANGIAYDTTGVSNTRGDNAHNSDVFSMSAIRCNSPYVYIFDVSSQVNARSGTDSGDGEKVRFYVSNIYSTSADNAAHIYGGDFSYSGDSVDGNAPAYIDAYIVRGSYKIASGGNINPSGASGANFEAKTIHKTTGSSSQTVYSVFVGDNGVLKDASNNIVKTNMAAENGIDMFSYDTFRQYLAQYGTALDIYHGNSIMSTNGTFSGNANSSAEVGSTNYLLNGYTQKGWAGKTHPGAAYDLNFVTPAKATITGGGSLFLVPAWEENVYTITYDWNDSDGATKVSNVDSCFATIEGKTSTYSITSTKGFGIPVRHGYKFTGWTVTQYEYPETDTKKPWSLATYSADTDGFNNFTFNGRNGHIWLQANWEVIEYYATFSLNGGNILGDTADIVKGYNVNKVFQFPQGVKKDYYDFTGYYKVVKADGSWPANDTLYAAGNTSAVGSYGSPTFEAVYTPIEYSIVYNSNLGSSVDDETAKVYTFESEKTLPAVTRPGHEFAGWYVEDPNTVIGNDSWVGGTTTDVDGNIVPVKLYPAGTELKGKHGNVILKAHWTSSKYKLNISIDETIGEIYTGEREKTYAYASPLELSSPTRAGYDFVGWKVIAAPDSGTTWIVGEEFKPAVKNGPVTIPANRMGSVTLAPMWEEITYTILFDTNGGQFCADFSYDITDSFILPEPVKKGYAFAGWSVSVKDGNWNDSLYYSGKSISGMYGNVTLRANWDAQTYIITLDPTEDGSVNPETLEYEFDFPEELPVPVKTGFDFVSWKISYVSPDGSWTFGTEYTDTLPAGQYGNMTLEAQWKHKEYNIHFVSSGTTPTDFKYHIDDAAFNVPASSYPGFEFLYWNVTTPSGNWAQDEKIYTDTDISGKYGNVTLNANFKAKPFTITYKDVDGSETVVTYDMQTPVTIPEYNKPGYRFGGWKVESLTDGEGWVGTYQPGPYTAGERYGNVVLVPDVTPIGYEITFIPDGGTPYANLAYTVEATDVLPTPEKTGYDFAGWKVTLAAGNWEESEIVAGSTAVTGKYGDVTLTAQWTPKKYAITWITGSGTFVTEEEYNTLPDASSVNKTKAPDAQYTYTFKEWSPALGTVTGEATYTAVYTKTVNSYTVTWQYETTDEAGVAPTVQAEAYNYGTHPVFNGGVHPEKISVNGKYYRFIGWTDLDGNEYSTDTVVTGDVTFVAQYKEVAAPRTVTWVIDGVRYETKWGVDELPEYAGTPRKADSNGMKYTFSGWDKPIEVVVADKDYEYVAEFTESPQSYEAVFDADGGVISGDSEVIYNKESGLKMPVPVKTGYTFMGWRVVANDGRWTQTDLLTSSTYAGYWGNVSFKAEYVATEYTIKLEASDGSTPEYKYTIESTDKLPDLSNEGFVLVGWTVVSAEGNWIAGDNVAPDKLLTGMYGDVTLHPLWTAKLYKITWISGDTEQVVEFKYGEATVTYPPIAKPGYTAVWDAAVPSVMPAEDLTFTAVYSPIQYYLRFNSAGGSAVENFYYDITSDGVLPTPTREGATFVGWKVSAGSGSWVKNKIYPEGTSLNGQYGNITFTAVWEIQTHTITWLAGDVTKVTVWYHGAVPSYDGIPYKSSDDYHSYEFIGWNKEIVVVTEDATYEALFEATQRKYLVKWNVDGHIVEEKYYFYGETPVFGGLTPTRPSTSEFDFTFTGWSPEVNAVTGDITYVAAFDVFTKLQGLRVNKTAVFLNIGDTEIVAAIISPATASNKDVNWISSNTSVAEIDANGRITAVGTGDTLIRVESKDGKFKSYCVVSVAPVATQFILVTAGGLSTTRLPGESIYLSAVVMPENATNKNVKWSSSDTAVATVDQNGLVVFGEKIGTAVITAVADGYAKGSIEVTTTDEAEEVKDNVKTYMVMFMESTSAYIINGVTYEAVSIILEEGDSIEFTLTEPHFVTLNGIQYERDTDGVYRINNIDNNYTVMSVERPDLGFEEDDDSNKEMSFFDKLKAFFKKILDFFKNLFG